MKQLLVGLGLLGLLFAQAQVAYDQANSLRLARFGELVRVKMAALAVQPSEEVAEEMRESFALFAGSLEGLEPTLARKLEAALEQAEALAGAGKSRSLRTLNLRVNRLITRVQQTLIPAKTLRDPAFQAALLAQLVNLEGGVAEAYEEAANGEGDAYTLAWAGLQRAKLLWRPLRRQFTDKEAIGKVDDAFTRLSKLIASPESPDRLSDPEDAEQAALDAVFGLEQAAGRPLLVQDLGKGLELARRYAAQACKAAENSRWPLAAEWAGAAEVYYGEHLGATLQTLVPETHGQLAPLLATLREEASAQKSSSAGCARLPGLLTQAGGALR